jgi:hypothetical protein
MIRVAALQLPQRRHRHVEQSRSPLDPRGDGQRDHCSLLVDDRRSDQLVLSGKHLAASSKRSRSAGDRSRRCAHGLSLCLLMGAQPVTNLDRERTGRHDMTSNGCEPPISGTAKKIALLSTISRHHIPMPAWSKRNQ